MCPADGAKTVPGECGCGTPETGPMSCAPGTDPPPGGCEVMPVPDAVREAHDLDPFYQKYVDANDPRRRTDDPDPRVLDTGSTPPTPRSRIA